MVFDVGKCHILPNAQQIRYLGASYLVDYELKLRQLLRTYATKQSTFIEEHDDNIMVKFGEMQIFFLAQQYNTWYLSVMQF